MGSAVFIRDPETPNSPRPISKSVAENRSHTLEIQGFSSTKGMTVGKFISSNTFSVGGHRWKIKFYPNGKDFDKSGDEVYVSFYIELVSKCEEGVEAYIEYVLFDHNGNKWHKLKDGNFIIGPYMGGPNMVKSTWGIKKFYNRTELEASRFIINDCLTIQCTIGVLKTSSDVPKTFAQSLPLSDLGQSYAHLLESKEGSDVSFEVEGETFYAHKLILSTRSPVFKTQFFGPLKEENTGCIKIEEIQFFGALKEENTGCIKIEEMQAPVFKALLHFIYCDVIPDLDSKSGATIMTKQLLAAANQYRIERLRSLCEARLKSTCLEFIGPPENIKAVMQTDGFKNSKEKCYAVIDDLLNSVANGQSFQEVDKESFSCYRGVAHICSSSKRLLFRLFRAV